MAKSLKLDIDDDVKGDMIDIFLGKPFETDNYDVDFNFTLRISPKTKRLVGLIVLQFSDLFPNASDSKSRHLIAEALFTMFDRLHREGVFKEVLAA